MDIWIIKDGERVGPIRDFDVRRRIESGEFSADTPAWHEGLPGWIPLGEISLFQHEFRAPDETHEPTIEPVSQSPTPPPLPAKPAIMRRFWARWMDLYLFSGLWWLAMWVAGGNIAAALMNPWQFLLLYIPWFAIESALIHKFGTTPGKWLLGLRVSNDDGSRLSLAQATRRSMRVFFMGIGFGWAPLTLVCQILAFFTAKRLGRTLWDQTGGHRVDAVPLGAARITTSVTVFLAALYLNMIVLYPYAAEQTARRYPSLREQFDENPPWHLPRNR